MSWGITEYSPFWSFWSRTSLCCGILEMFSSPSHFLHCFVERSSMQAWPSSQQRLCSITAQISEISLQYHSVLFCVSALQTLTTSTSPNPDLRLLNPLRPLGPVWNSPTYALFGKLLAEIWDYHRASFVFPFLEIIVLGCLLVSVWNNYFISFCLVFCGGKLSFILFILSHLAVEV